MRYSLLVTAGPESPAAASALHMAKALLARDHALFRIFFYRQGVHLASADNRVAADNTDICAQWRAFLREQEVEAVVCVGAAQRRGLDSDKLAAGFSLAGLGLWAEAVAVSDRVLSFGA
ncbi:sulfurtransferase complex subunit TusD [Alcanivorax sp. JB21]|uniref:sulfurtransferase complex subunit TusD n=1 Tax=Alcanivorax limicola TaxID=2874102 RepID=UPI001CBC4477|nr:sulfurtransferase complex subunit TusD [Alcanivorax limicola]MBZ2187830.1 sulfurtransferase complex subunit TusD [Alcanivorax limicola]